MKILRPSRLYWDHQDWKILLSHSSATKGIWNYYDWGHVYQNWGNIITLVKCKVLLHIKLVWWQDLINLVNKLIFEWKKNKFSLCFHMFPLCFLMFSPCFHTFSPCFHMFPHVFTVPNHVFSCFHHVFLCFHLSFAL